MRCWLLQLPTSLSDLGMMKQNCSDGRFDIHYGNAIIYLKRVVKIGDIFKGFEINEEEHPIESGAVRGAVSYDRYAPQGKSSFRHELFQLYDQFRRVRLGELGVGMDGFTPL